MRRRDGHALVNARAVNVAFDSNDELAQLQIVTDMRAANHTAGVIAEAVVKSKLITKVDVLAASCVADLATDIDAGPSEDRRRRDIDRRRSARRKIRSEGGSGDRHRRGRGQKGEAEHINCLVEESQPNASYAHSAE